MHETVSVIVPTYNQTEKFERAIRSIVNQNYKNIEIVVVDDNVNQKTSREIVRILKDINTVPIIYYKNEVNVGSVMSRNKGIELSTGSYITFLDDDDYYDEEKIKKQLEKMLSNYSLYSVCNITLIHKNGLKKERNRHFLQKRESLITKHLKYHIAATSTFMFESSFLKEIGGFNNLDFGDDYYLMEKAIKKSDRFSHLNYTGVYADFDIESGLSSWENKIPTENQLFQHKSKSFNLLKKKDVRYVEMRHNLVKSYYYFKGKKYKDGIILLLKSFLVSPFNFINFLTQKHY